MDSGIIPAGFVFILTTRWWDDYDIYGVMVTKVPFNYAEAAGEFRDDPEYTNRTFADYLVEKGFTTKVDMWDSMHETEQKS